MGETEYIDIFSEHPKRDMGLDSGDGGLTDDFFNPGRSKINDYKRTSNTIHKSNGASVSEDFSSPAGNNPGRKYINLSDERIVWAGAIFVFFGVFVFLIGYWLGKTTVKEIGISSHQTIQRFEEKLDQKRAENALAVTPDPSAENPISPAIASAPVIEPATPAIEPNPGRMSAQVHKTTVAPPLQPARVSKNVRLQTKDSAARTTAMPGPVPGKTAVKTPAVEGNYTIQVSAHTSMEKARTVEDALRKMGFQSYLVEASINGVNYYRVRAGKFGAKEEAQKALERIKNSSIGKDSFLLNLK